MFLRGCLCNQVEVAQKVLEEKKLGGDADEIAKAEADLAREIAEAEEAKLAAEKERTEA